MCSLSISIKLTFDFLLYLERLTNGTSAKVSAVPNTNPPIKPAKFCCQGSVPIPNNDAAIRSNFIRAKYGFLSCFQ